MLFALHVADYGVLALYLAIMVAIGFYFSREQHTSKDFFLAGRSMGWFPIGLSIMATLLSALSYTGVPGEAYYAGLRFLLLPFAVWLTLPLLLWLVLPLYHNLRLFSVYEYLELRYDAPTRFAGSPSKTVVPPSAQVSSSRSMRSTGPSPRCRRWSSTET